MTDEPPRKSNLPGVIVGDSRILGPDEAHLLPVEQVGSRPVKRGKGRPTKCSPKTLAEIATLIQGGVHPADACGMIGISNKSRLRWLDRGRKALDDNPHARSIYAEFVRVMEGRSAIARGVLGAKLHKLGREGNLAAIQTWMRYFGVPSFQQAGTPPQDDGTSDHVVTIEFDGGAVFGGREIGEPEPDTDREPHDPAPTDD